VADPDVVVKYGTVPALAVAMVIIVEDAVVIAAPPGVAETLNVLAEIDDPTT